MTVIDPLPLPVNPPFPDPPSTKDKDNTWDAMVRHRLSPLPLLFLSQTRRTTKDMLDMIDDATRDTGWTPNTPPATPKTPVPHSPPPQK